MSVSVLNRVSSMASGAIHRIGNGRVVTEVYAFSPFASSTRRDNPKSAKRACWLLSTNAFRAAKSRCTNPRLERYCIAEAIPAAYETSNRGPKSAAFWPDFRACSRSVSSAPLAPAAGGIKNKYKKGSGRAINTRRRSTGGTCASRRSRR